MHSLFQSVSCRRLIVGLIVATAGPAMAQVDPGPLFRPWAKGKTAELIGDARLFGRGETDEHGEDDDIRITTYESRARWRITDKHPVNPTFSHDLLHMTIDSGFDGLPDRLVDQSIGFDSPLGRMGEWFVAAGAGAGYAGESMYNDGNAWYGKANLVIGRDFDEDRSLIIRLSYDGNRSIFPDLPFPGIAYSWKVSDTVRAVAGMPFNMIRWEPGDGRLSVLLMYQMPQSIEMRTTYDLTERLELFALFENRIHAFHVDGLGSDRRLFFEQQRLEAGIRLEPNENLRLLLAGGFAFNQAFSTGFDSRDLDEVTELSDEPYLRAGLELRF